MVVVMGSDRIVVVVWAIVPIIKMMMMMATMMTKKTTTTTAPISMTKNKRPEAMVVVTKEGDEVTVAVLLMLW